MKSVTYKRDISTEDTEKGKPIEGLYSWTFDPGEALFTATACQQATLKMDEQNTLLLRTSVPVPADEDLIIILEFENPEGEQFTGASVYLDGGTVLRNP